MRPVRWVQGPALCIVLAALMGCSQAAMQGKKLFSAGDYTGAAKAYEEAIARSGGHGKASWLYRLGVSRAVPRNGAYDPTGAMEAFKRLRKDFPGSKYARRAALPMALLEALEKADRRAAVLKHQLAETRFRLKDAARDRTDLDRCRQRVQELSDRVDEQNKVVADLRNELQQLKNIDLHRGR